MKLKLILLSSLCMVGFNLVACEEEVAGTRFVGSARPFANSVEDILGRHRAPSASDKELMKAAQEGLPAVQLADVGAIDLPVLQAGYVADREGVKLVMPRTATSVQSAAARRAYAVIQAQRAEESRVAAALKAEQDARVEAARAASWNPLVRFGLKYPKF